MFIERGNIRYICPDEKGLSYRELKFFAVLSSGNVLLAAFLHLLIMVFQQIKGIFLNIHLVEYLLF